MADVEARRRFATARIAVLASSYPGGGPHQVPITFAVDAGSDVVLSVLDGKPKRASTLQRHVNLAADPRASLLAQHFDEDWARLWWVRADGRAALSEDPADLQLATRLLRAKYPQYATVPVSAPVIVLRVQRWSGWHAWPS